MNQTQLVERINQKLAIDTVPDHYCPNGLQVEGDGRLVKKVALAVSIGLEVIEQANHWGAELLVTHHGLFWKHQSQTVTGPMAKKLKALLGTGLASASYHLPLDFHPELGNNIQLAKLLGLTEIRFLAPKGEINSMVMGRPAQSTIEALGAQSEALLGAKPLVLNFGPQKIERLVICSGGAQSGFVPAIALGAQAYLTGEASEYVFGEAKENGVHYLAAGHYKTERLGILALGDWLAQEFKLDCRFFEVENPI